MTDLVASARAFDLHADGYDDVAESALGIELRGRVHDVVSPLLDVDTVVVDLGCGTGIDAAWLGNQVGHVHAFEPSAEMVERARRRCERFGNVTIELGTIGTIAQAEPADLVLANFGVVNCVDGPTLRGQLGAMVRPGGHAVLVTMARCCPIELGIGLATANRALLARRRGDPSPESKYAGLKVRYASAAELAAAIRPDFELLSAQALGVALPPFEQRAWIESRPRPRGALAWLDRRLARAAASVGLGDHHIAVFRKADRA